MCRHVVCVACGMCGHVVCVGMCGCIICITNAFYLMIILVSGDSLDIKELTYAIIINFFYILMGFEHIYYRHLYIFMCIRRRIQDPGREVLII